MIEFKLTGKIPSKKNTWQKGKYGQIYQSQQNALNGLLLQLKVQKARYNNLPLKNDCRLFVCVWGDNRQDLDNQITTICDLLQKSEIIKNDRQIKQIEAEKIKDNKNSRVEIEINEF